MRTTFIDGIKYVRVPDFARNNGICEDSLYSKFYNDRKSGRADTPFVKIGSKVFIKEVNELNDFADKSEMQELFYKAIELCEKDGSSFYFQMQKLMNEPYHRIYGYFSRMAFYKKESRVRYKAALEKFIEQKEAELANIR
jgi:hypothetical protein